MVIKVYAPTSDAEEAERLYEDLQDLLELTPPKDVFFILLNIYLKTLQQLKAFCLLAINSVL